MSRITSERDSLKIKLQEADYQLKHLQTKLDQALTEKNYLQAHASEANPLINIHSPDESKDKNGYSNWIISLQSLVGYIQYMPAYFLFSFQITFLNLMCSILFRDKLSPILLKLNYVNPRVSGLLYFFCCVLGYPISCELIGFLGWMSGFSVSKRNMANIPSPIGLMVRSGSDIVSDWVFKDNALLLWLLCIFIGGIITFISHMWYHALSKRLKDNGFEKRHILLTMIFTLVLLNQCLYRIFSWFTGVTMGPRTYINWLGARKAVSSLLSILIYSLAALFTLRLFHVNMPNLIKNVFHMSQKLFFSAKSKSAK
ncbi:unnamed protein product [Meganyctiphanes norvegica]|uniref:Vomeronasal type-1 receptor n=1 Tax=Meganyctiphanes norvegica TaxID=48144 RepID=A0AAV2PU68_MEGNR